MPGFKHGKICHRFSVALGVHVDDRDCGHVTTNDSLVQIRPRPLTIFGPDVAYYSYERLPRGDDTLGVSTVIPDLVVEVRSPSDPWGEVLGKVGQYLAAGVRAVVVPDFATRSVAVYRAGMAQELFAEDADLVLPDILPGFATRVGKLFA